MKTHDQMTFKFNDIAAGMPVPRSEPQQITITLDSESLNCLRQCLSADRAMLEEEFGWPDWMMQDVIEHLEDSATIKV